MAVYLYKFFDKMSELNITQKELMQRIGASSATLTKMRNNQNVSLEVLARICEELNCDIGDLLLAYRHKQNSTLKITICQS